MLFSDRWGLLGLLCLLMACAPGDDSGVLDTAPEETGRSDTAIPGLTALQGRTLQAVVLGGGFQGVEEVYFVSDYGMGPDICRYQYSLTSVGERQDCGSCDWAFDLIVSDAELLFEEAPGCMETLGVDSSGLDALGGQVISYGYTEEYFGHAQVVLMDVGTSWAAVTNAAWDSDSGVFSFDWQEGYVGY